MSDVRETHRRIESALEDGDVERAMDLRTDLQEAAEPIDELLAEFEAAVEDGDYEEAETVRQSIRERLAERRAEDKAAIQRSTVARDGADLSAEQRQAVRDHIAAGMELSSARASFLTISAVYLSRPQDADDEAVLSRTENLRERETQYQEREQAAAETTETVEIPPSVEIVASGIDRSTVAVDESTTARVRLRNVGGEPATGIEAVAESTDALAATPAERSIDELAADGDATVEFRVTGRETGDHRLGVTVGSETGEASHTRISVEVAAEAEPSPLLAAFSDGDGSVRFEDVVDAIATYNDGETIPDTDQRVAFQDVMWVIERYNEGE